MQKIIIDTNVIVSALISNSIPNKILYELILLNRVKICLSEEVFNEYLEVLSRDKFTRIIGFKVRADIVLERIREIATFYEVNQKISLLKDESDNKFLELALLSKADYLTTGNTNDFVIDKLDNTRILTPREYWDRYAPK